LHVSVEWGSFLASVIVMVKLRSMWILRFALR